MFGTVKPQGQQFSEAGFTLLEVMIAVGLIAIGLTAMLGNQSQSVSLANEAKFNTSAAFLAQSKLAELEFVPAAELNDDSGDFGEDFPGFRWAVTINDVDIEGADEVADYLQQVNLALTWGEKGQYKYYVRYYQFLPTP